MSKTLSNSSEPDTFAGRTVWRTQIYSATAALLLVAMVLTGLFLWQYWTSLIKDVQSKNAMLAYILAEQTTRTFQAVDLTLVGLESAFDANAPPIHSPTFEALLARRVAELDIIHSIHVVDPSGQVTQSTAATWSMMSDFSARRYFQAFARDRTLEFLIGKPAAQTTGTRNTLPVIRRLTTVDGRFAGLLVAEVQPKYFSDFYRNLENGRRGSIDLYQDNGSILLASNSEPVIALESTADAPPVFEVGAKLGLFRSRSASAGQRFVAYHRAEDYPLVVAVGMDVGDVRARWWHVAVPTLGAVAVVMGLVLALAVVVNRRLDERRRIQSRAITTQKLEALGQMTATVSHDFRNLLAVMSASIQLLRKHGPSEKILGAAEEAVARGNGLVTQLLAFSRRRELQLQPADINVLLSGIEQVLRHAAGPGVRLVVVATESLPTCMTDHTQFDAALMNLVVNASQAMPRGGTLSITTALAPPAADKSPCFVELTVRDTGDGIAPGDIKRIFEPFFTTKAKTGTGLGLTQVHEFMRQIGGDVAVSSVVGSGTTFSLLFPVAAVGHSRPPAALWSLARASEPASLRKPLPAPE